MMLKLLPNPIFVGNIYLCIKESKNNSKFIIPIFTAKKKYQEKEENKVQQAISDFKLYQGESSFNTRLEGLDFLKKTPLTDSSWKYRLFNRSRQKRNIENHNSGLVLKKPSVFNDLDVFITKTHSHGSQTKPETLSHPSVSIPPSTSSNDNSQRDPSTFYQVPPASPTSENPVNMILPSSSISPGANANISYYDEDISLDPSSVIPQLQHQVS